MALDGLLQRDKLEALRVNELQMQQIVALR
jgi:hypothetical protein